MKFIKKLSVMAVAAVAAMVLAVPAFAADETYGISINTNAPGHTYEAYQIFEGDLHEGVLSNIVWGESVSNAGSLGDAAAIAERLDPNYQGQDKLSIDALLKMVTLGNPVASANEVPYEMTGLEPGYYLVKDQDKSLDGTSESYTEFIVKVVGNVSTAPKGTTTQVEKKVDDVNDSNATEDDVRWQDSADYDIGDSVPFQLKATLADNVAKYSTYEITFYDTLSAGLTFEKITGVTIDGKPVTGGYVLTQTENGFTVAFADVKKQGATSNSVVIVEYTATLNENAVIGSKGNPNKVYLEFSNNPNGEGTGKTPDDTVIVFTYKVDVNKVDQDKKPLVGATFELFKKVDGEWESLGEIAGTEESEFAWTGIDDGEYKLVEVKAPAGYNKIDDILFTVTAEHDILSDSPELTALNGGDLFTGDVDAGTLSTDVENKPGSTLPETGGMGTTILYVLGGVLVLGAGAALVVKRRMAASK